MFDQLFEVDEDPNKEFLEDEPEDNDDDIISETLE